MGDIQEEADYNSESRDVNRLTIAEKIKDLEAKARLAKMEAESEREKKPFRFPFNWKRGFGKVGAKMNKDKVLVFYISKRNEIEPPKFMSVYDGNMIVWNHKVHEYDPRALLWIKYQKKIVPVYLIREIDRRPIRNNAGDIVMYRVKPISNLDKDDVVARGDSTDSDELLIKAFLKAQVKENKIKGNWILWAIIGLVVVGGLIFVISKIKF